jgi:hypothetical protein
MPEQITGGQAGGGKEQVDYEALYKEAHPGAVDDVKKAELMAHAGDEFETQVVEERRKALEHASQAAISDEGYDHTDAAYDHADAAKAAREEADMREGFVGRIYERTKDL